jgi:hypothetical protein
MNLSGQWTGTIIYGSEYGHLAGKSLQFDLEITQKDKKIRGISNDIGGVGINPDPADIEGELIGSKLNFVKQYRTMQLSDGRNTIDKSRKGPKIIYFGKYDDDVKEFIGTWNMSIMRKFFGLIPINRQSAGTWKMKRKK